MTVRKLSVGQTQPGSILSYPIIFVLVIPESQKNKNINIMMSLAWNQKRLQCSLTGKLKFTWRTREWWSIVFLMMISHRAAIYLTNLYFSGMVSVCKYNSHQIVQLFLHHHRCSNRESPRYVQTVIFRPKWDRFCWLLYLRSLIIRLS